MDLLLRDGRGGKREGVKWEGRGRGEGRGGEGGEGRGEEAFLVMWPRRLSALNPPLDACRVLDIQRRVHRVAVDRNGDKTTIKWLIL